MMLWLQHHQLTLHITTNNTVSGINKVNKILHIKLIHIFIGQIILAHSHNYLFDILHSPSSSCPCSEPSIPFKHTQRVNQHLLIYSSVNELNKMLLRVRVRSYSSLRRRTRSIMSLKHFGLCSDEVLIVDAPPAPVCLFFFSIIYKEHNSHHKF